MEVHTSELQTFKACPRKYRYQYVLGFEPKWQAGLTLGTWGHKALEAYYAQGADPAQVFRQEYEHWLEEVKDQAEFLLDDDAREEIEVVEEVLKAYPEWARKNDNFRVVYVEREFRVPIYKPGTRQIVAWHAGRLDAVVEDEWGNWWLLDHKFLSSLPSMAVLERDEQMGRYLLAASRLLEAGEFRRVRGAIYNVLRKVRPSRARTEIFRRYPILRSHAELRYIARDLWATTVRLLEEMVRGDWLANPGPVQCGGCLYEQLCRLENQGADPEDVGRWLFESQSEVVPDAAFAVGEA